MTDLTKLMAALSKFIDDDDVKVYDLNTDEGLIGFNEQLDQLENMDSDLLEAFGIDSKTWIDQMRKLGTQIHDQKENTKKEPVPARKVIDHTEGKTFNRPSELLSVDQKLQLHKIVQEYVDTMIKPFNNGHLSTNEINDAYAVLFEFAAWVMNR